jgi:hypothetical protein
VQKLNSVSWPGDEKDARLTFTSLTTKPLFAIKGINNLRPGDVDTVYFGRNWATNNHDVADDSELSTGYRREFSVGQREYLLRMSTGLMKDGTKLAILVLESDGVKQVIWQSLHVPSDGRDIIGNLLWLGDMDRDGKLDLYFDEFNEKGYTGTYPFMSSFADDGKLVEIAASFGAAGC